jgi:hypothetical protein
MPRLGWKQWVAVCLLAPMLPGGLPQSPVPPVSPVSTNTPAGMIPPREQLHYHVEWRLIRAGEVKLGWGPKGQGGWNLDMSLESVGLVSRLYPVKNAYSVQLDNGLCAQRSHLLAHEGRKHRETTVQYDREQGKASYSERDLPTNKIVGEKTVDIPPCVYDVMGGLYRLRTMNVPPGQAVDLPVSDGKKTVVARVEAQRTEEVETPAGKYRATRYEVFLFRDVLYRRNASLYVWLSEDERRLPVQVRIRMPFYIGTVTLQLMKGTNS